MFGFVYLQCRNMVVGFDLCLFYLVYSWFTALVFCLLAFCYLVVGLVVWHSGGFAFIWF